MHDAQKNPSIGRLAEDPSVLCGFGYQANGVNTAPWAGKQIADMIATGDDGERRIPVSGHDALVSHCTVEAVVFTLRLSIL